MRNQVWISYKIAIRKTRPSLMQEPFLVLTKLKIEYHSPPFNVLVPVLPSAPHLRSLSLKSISFPTLPKFLLSASNLVYLHLDGPPFGFISPEMVAALSALTKLEIMHLSFCDPISDSDLEDTAPLPVTRSALLALKELELQGDGEYLDDFVARIDLPSIDYLKIVFNNEAILLVGSIHLPHFIGRIEKFRTFDCAGFLLSPRIEVTLSPQRWTHGSRPAMLQLNSLCEDSPPQPLVEACN